MKSFELNKKKFGPKAIEKIKVSQVPHDSEIELLLLACATIDLVRESYGRDESGIQKAKEIALMSIPERFRNCPLIKTRYDIAFDFIRKK